MREIMQPGEFKEAAMLLINSLSLNMVATFPVTVVAEEISLNEAKAALEGNLESAVGHADTAAVYSEQLGLPVPANRITIALKKGDELIVGQYRGPRMPEGCKTLPAGATIQWLRVNIQ